MGGVESGERGRGSALLLGGALLLAGVVLVGAAAFQWERGQPPGLETEIGLERAQQISERIEARLDGVELSLEVADSDPERAVGLMHRDEVPPGTGMIFRYPEPVQVRFYMYNVAIPLKAVFIREGRVVGVEVMEPCPARDPAQCPTYGPAESFDTVVEVDPETLPEVAVGDQLVLEQGASAG